MALVAGHLWSCRPCLQSSYQSPRRPTLSHALPLQLRGAVSSRAFSTNPMRQVPEPVKHFAFSIAASYIGKGRKYNSSKHVHHHDNEDRALPPVRRSKASWPESGQDSFFVNRINDTGGVAVGVADGVGGWVESGVDPAEFAHGLCSWMALATAAYKSSDPLPVSDDPRNEADGKDGSSSTHSKPIPITPKRIMQIGYEALCADNVVQAGGSTALVATFQSQGEAEIANLGDSGFLHFRNSAVHTASKAQTHDFNTPYQLSIIPPAMLYREALFGRGSGARIHDLPRDADVTHHSLRHGDVLVFATDGVLDNLFPKDMLRIVNSVMSRNGVWTVGKDGETEVMKDLAPVTIAGQVAKEKSLQSLIATEIVAAARAASINQWIDTPFSVEGRKFYPREDWRGGKVDDICVIAVVVSQVGGPAPPVVKSKL